MILSSILVAKGKVVFMNGSYHTKLIEIRESESFKDLKDFENPNIWNELKDKDRELLATLFYKSGIKSFHAGEGSHALKAFDRAREVAPNSKHVLWLLVKFFILSKDNIRLQEKACHTLADLMKLPGAPPEGWLLWGIVLYRIGSFDKNIDKLQQALEKFQLAEKSISFHKKSKIQELYWYWGKCYFGIGEISGEAVDYRESQVKFHYAFTNDLSTYYFLYDYALTLKKLGDLLEHVEYYHETCHLLERVLKKNKQFGAAWYHLGETYYHIFTMTLQDTCFLDSCRCYHQATMLEPMKAKTWLKWGETLLFYGQLTKNAEKLEESIKKLETADELQPNDPEILSLFGEALLTNGSFHENLNFILMAEKIVLKSLEINSKHLISWDVYGTCLCELGHYFSDPSYFHRAIDAFEQALTLDSHHGLIWHGLALAYFGLGEQLHSQEAIEKAVRICNRVEKLSQHHTPQFWNDWGMMLFRYGQFMNDERYIQLALEKFQNALSYDWGGKQNPDYLLNVGSCFGYLGELTHDIHAYEKAIDMFLKVLEIDTKYKEAYYQAAMAYHHLGELVNEIECLNKACRYFQQYLNIEPEDDEAWLEWGTTLMCLAQLVEDPVVPMYSNRAYEDAEAKLHQALSLGSTHAFYYLACLYSMTEKFDVSLYFLERAFNAKAHPEFDFLLQDDWLRKVRETGAFQKMIEDILREQE